MTDLDYRGNYVKQYTNVTQFTIEPSSVVDASDAYKFQFSIYRTDPYADLKHQAGRLRCRWGRRWVRYSEHEIVFSQANGNAIGSGQWVPVEVKMSDLTGLWMGSPRSVRS